MMPRLLREHGPCLLVASKLRGVVSLISREVAHEIRRKNVLPGKRLHVVLSAAPLVLSLRFLVRQIRDVKTRVVKEQIEPKKILVAWGVVDLREAVYGLTVVMGIFNSRRIEKTIRGRARRANEVAELACMAADVK